jgi:hypothetical protein
MSVGEFGASALSDLCEKKAPFWGQCVKIHVMRILSLSAMVGWKLFRVTPPIRPIALVALTQKPWGPQVYSGTEHQLNFYKSFKGAGEWIFIYIQAI